MKNHETAFDFGSIIQNIAGEVAQGAAAQAAPAIEQSVLPVLDSYVEERIPVWAEQAVAAAIESPSAKKLRTQIVIAHVVFGTLIILGTYAAASAAQRP